MDFALMQLAIYIHLGQIYELSKLFVIPLFQIVVPLRAQLFPYYSSIQFLVSVGFSVCILWVKKLSSLILCRNNWKGNNGAFLSFLKKWKGRLLIVRGNLIRFKLIKFIFILTFTNIIASS